MNNNIGKLENKTRKKSAFREYAEAIITAVLIALFIRSFGVEAFKIPSSSMIPTLLIGDHIFVNKFIYGFRIPLTKVRFLELKKPRRGEVIVFMYPEDEHKDFIKRVIGLPGDTVRIDGDKIYVNEDEISRRWVKVEASGDKNELVVTGGEYEMIPKTPGWQRFDYLEEDVEEDKIIVQYEKDVFHRSGEYKVPEDYLFVMGDNRDNSSDSREWGFVPIMNVKGKAMFIWLSLDKDNKRIRLERLGKWIH